jgi:hypothetical protein
MSKDATKILAGAGVFSYGDYVTAGGAGSLADAGHIKNPFELGTGFANFDVKTERSAGIVKTVPIDSDFTLKVAFHQAETELMRVALGQPSGNKSGSGANLTLLVGDRAEQYHQATLVVPGPGTTATRTLTFWKLQVLSTENISFGKGIEQMYIVTFRVLRDDSVSTNDKFFKQVDT